MLTRRGMLQVSSGIARDADYSEAVFPAFSCNYKTARI
jgi:hypothetical protein